MTSACSIPANVTGERTVIAAVGVETETWGVGSGAPAPNAPKCVATHLHVLEYVLQSDIFITSTTNRLFLVVRLTQCGAKCKS